MELKVEDVSKITGIHDSVNQAGKLFSSERLNEQMFTIKEALANFGLLRKEINVYLYLVEAGPKRAKEIGEATTIHRTETYRLLHHLEKKGLVFSIFGKPVKFTAVPLDKAIDLLVETQKIKIQIFQNQKANLVKLWMSMPLRRTEQTRKELFQKIQGEQQIVLKANEILQKTHKRLQIFAPDDYLAELYYGGFFDRLKNYQNKLEISLLTGNSRKSDYFVEQIRWPREQHILVETQNLPCFIISDRNELLIAFYESESSSEFSHKRNARNTAIWTNYPAIVWTFETLFLKLFSLPKISEKTRIPGANCDPLRLSKL